MSSSAHLLAFRLLLAPAAVCFFLAAIETRFKILHFGWLGALFVTIALFVR